MSATKVLLQGGLGNQLFQASVAHELAASSSVQVSTGSLGATIRGFSAEPIVEALKLDVTSEACCEKPFKMSPRTAKGEVEGRCCVEVFPMDLGWGSHVTAQADFAEAFAHLVDVRTADKDSVTVHVRLGDYLWPRNSKSFGVLSQAYYLGILQERAVGRQVRIITEDPEALRRLYPKLIALAHDVAPARTLRADFSDLVNSQLLITANSTLSLWAAWFVQRRSGNAVLPADLKRDGSATLFVDGDVSPSQFISPTMLAVRHPWTLTRRLAWQGKWWL